MNCLRSACRTASIPVVLNRIDYIIYLDIGNLYKPVTFFFSGSPWQIRIGDLQTKTFASNQFFQYTYTEINAEVSVTAQFGHSILSPKDILIRRVEILTISTRANRARTHLLRCNKLYLVASSLSGYSFMLD